MKTNPLFPEMEKEIADGKLAERREATQHARNFLRSKSGYVSFIDSHLRANGPTADVSVSLAMLEIGDVEIRSALVAMIVMGCMWQTGALWRRRIPCHPSGRECFVYGIRGVHKAADFDAEPEPA